jgi:two-component system NarL family response regulator
MSIRVLVADDNALFREGMVGLLAQQADVTVVGEATDAQEVVRKVSLLRPDVVLMDLAMPGGGGVAATAAILGECPTLPICMLTVSEQETDLFAALRAGARGYLVKSVSLAELHSALLSLAAGGAVISPHLATRLLEAFATQAAVTLAPPAEITKLTAREREVLQLVAQGAGNKQIADQLVIAENTVKVHLRNILDKLQLRNRQQAAAFAVQYRLAETVRPALTV